MPTRILVVGFVLVFAARGPAQTTYQITNVGTFGGTNSRGIGINNNGQIAGYYGALGSYSGFLWTGGVGRQHLSDRMS